MSKSDEVKEKIIEEFKKELNKHLFSDKDYPKEVTIRTLYEGGAQTLIIKFDK